MRLDAVISVGLLAGLGFPLAGRAATLLDGAQLDIRNAAEFRRRLGLADGQLVTAGSNVTVVTNLTSTNITYRVSSSGGTTTVGTATSAGGGLTNLNGLTNASQSFAAGTAGADFAISSAGSTHTFNLPTASSGVRGALSSADWSAFNAKQGAITVQTNGVTLATIPTTWNFGPGLTGYVSGATVFLGNSVAGGGDVTTAQLLYVSNQVQTASNKFETDTAPWTALTTNKVVTTNDAWLDRVASNRVEVAAGAAISVASANSGNKQVFTVNVSDAELLEWSGISTNKVVMTNDAWLDRVASNRVEVAAGSGISVASANSGNKQVFTVTATGGGGGGSGWSGYDAPATNATFWSSDTNRTNVIIAQRTGQAVPMFVVRGSNDAPLVYLDNRGFTVVSNAVTSYGQRAPTNMLVQGVDDYAGRQVPEWWDQYGLSMAVQPALFNNRITMLSPGSGTTVGIIGAATGNAGGTTIAHPTRDQTFHYMTQIQSAATSNSVGGLATTVDLALCSVGAGSVRDRKAGFFFATEFCTTNGTANVSAGGGSPRIVTGLTATATPNYTNILNTTNGTGQYIAAFLSPRDTTNIWISARDGTAEFRTNTGIICAASNLYQLYLFNSPTSTFVGWRVKDMTMGVSASGWFSNNVPTNTMKMFIGIKNSTSQVHSVRLSKMYLEAPLNP